LQIKIIELIKMVKNVIIV